MEFYLLRYNSVWSNHLLPTSADYQKAVNINIHANPFLKTFPFQPTPRWVVMQTDPVPAPAPVDISWLGICSAWPCVEY